MEDLSILTAFNTEQTYPRNIADHNLAPYALDAISHHLDTQAPRLFADESQAALDFLDLGDHAADFWPSRVENGKRLKEHLKISPSQFHRCRFLFVHAAHSRARLNVSSDMLKSCFTHFQVMPEFVEFLLPFGYQEYAQDFYFSGFRQRTQLSDHHRNASPDAKSANKRFQICWNLKSVEPSDSDEWSIRQCAIYHSFNLLEVRTSWIIVKGDELMKKRIESAVSDRGHQDMSRFGSLDRAFEASLETHLIFCRWAAENWRWYINSIEDRFQNKTRNTFSAPIRVATLPASEVDQFTPKTRTNTWRTFGSKSSMSWRTETQITPKESLKANTNKGQFPAQTYTNPDTGISQPLPPDEDEDEEAEGKGSSNPSDIKIGDENREFSFASLREIHKLAEKANEAILSLKQNIIVLTQLKQYYRSISTRQKFPSDLAGSCKDAVDNFGLCIEGLEHDMQTQVLRLETLLRLMQERKTLLHGILDYQNTQANKYSTRSMFTMTEDMNDIAHKTKIETASMKIITLVTLFFLPGTFISVGRILLSTLMSTNIFDPNSTRSGSNPYANLNPIQLYLALSLPLTAVVLLFWACFHLWELRHEKRQTSQHKAADWQV